MIVCVKHRYLCQLGVQECPECKEEEDLVQRCLTRTRQIMEEES